jgi:hypothetical protein
VLASGGSDDYGEGVKLALRPMIPTDAETFASWAEDPVFRAHAGWSQDMTVDRVASWWREIIEHPDPRFLGADSRYLRFHLSRADWVRGSPFRSAR